MYRSLLLTAAVAVLSLPAWAQSSRYSTWSNPDASNSQSSGSIPAQVSPDAQLQEFRDKLNKLVDEAEKARAADPKFLQDLRALAQGTPALPARQTVLSDDFSDGDFTRDPAWTVTQGTYFIEKGWGLRNKLVEADAQAERKLSNEEKALQLFGAILGGQVNTGSRASGSNEPAKTDIHTQAKIPNAFSLEAEIYSVVTPGTTAITVYQGAARGAGYRLVYVAGKGIELQRYSSRGTSVVDATRQPINLEDKKAHRIDWMRGTDGAMTVRLDGQEIIKTVDRGFRDPFSGIQLSTRGGDFIIKRVAVSGTP